MVSYVPAGNKSQPKPICAQEVAVNDQTYKILRFSQGSGPTLAQTKAIAEELNMTMLTFQEAIKIGHSPESRSILAKATSDGYAYIDNPKGPNTISYTEESWTTSLFTNTNIAVSAIILKCSNCKSDSEENTIALLRDYE